MRNPLVRTPLLGSSLILLAGLGGSIAGCRPPARHANDAGKREVVRSIDVTRVKLDFVNRPVDEVVAAIQERSSLPVSLAREAGGRNKPATQPILLSLTEAEPVPFWEALERVMRPAGLQIQTVRGLSGPVELKLVPLRGTRGPVWIDGAFRCEVLSLDYRRTLAFGKPAAPNVQGRPLPTRRGDSGPDVGPALESLRVQIQIRPEPRPGLKFVSTGVPRVIEATDEKGRSMVANEGELKGLGALLITGGIGAMVAQLPLALPDPSGASIAKLKGVAPFVVRVSRPDALDGPLANAAGRTFDGSGASLAISRCETTGSGRMASSVVELVFRFGTSPSPVQLSELEGLTFHDEQGRLVPGLRTFVIEPTGGMRLTFHFPGQLPARVHYVGSLEASIAVHFEFAEIPLP